MLLEKQAERMEEFDQTYQKTINLKEKYTQQFQLLQDRIKDETEDLTATQKKQTNSERLIKDAEANLNELRKTLAGLEKSIRVSETRIQENLVLTRVRKFSKIFGGMALIIGLTFFIIGLTGIVFSFAFPIDFLRNLNYFLLIFGGVLIFGSGLLHLVT